MRAIVMAGGDGTRWGNHRGRPKHLVDVDGERLLERTVRQLDERGLAVVILAVPGDRRYHVPPAYVIPPEYRECDTDKFLSTVAWWLPTAPTVIVYGDVFLTDAAADAIATPRAGLTWYGRELASDITGCEWGELFAVSVPPVDHGRLAAAIVHVRGLHLAGVLWRGGGWEVYRATQGADLDEHLVVGDWHEIDDWTDDFDFPEDYERWSQRRASRS